MIICSEKCLYEEDGLCTLKTVIPSSSTPTPDCPYFTERKRKNKS